MLEKAMRRIVVEALRPLDAHAVENRVGPGTPDVNFSDGWIELKCMNVEPRKRDALFPIRHFAPQQRVWLLRRWRAGGNVWMLIRVGRWWMLLDGATAATSAGRVSLDNLEYISYQVWERVFDKAEFLKLMSGGRALHLANSGAAA